MGMFDTFVYDCPNCGKEATSQTKLGECLLLSLTIGCEFSQNGKIQMKDCCKNCGDANTVIVSHGIIVGFGKEKIATHEEKLWGEFIQK